MKKNKKYLAINVYYAPNSFGGATIVAEELNKQLSEKHNYDVSVITSFQDDNFTPYHVRKYTVNDATVYAINLPKHIDYEGQYKNDKISKIVLELTGLINPDLVHLHSIQLLGAGIIFSLSERIIPIYLTIHDCWWICDRQFMINREGKYCFQKKIDPNVCLHCVNMHKEYEERMRYLNNALKKVDFFLFPSAFHMQTHLDNGFDPNRCFVSKNGVIFPQEEYEKTPSEKIRFGFTGGPGQIKGFDLIIKAFKEIKRSNYELIVVDGAKNLGKSWSHAFNHAGIEVTIAPPYTMDTMDDFYKDIDVLLFPSQWKESFGLTVREALVRNIWVISTNGGGTTEDLKDGENSTIIPISSDHSYLKDAIRSLLSKDLSDFVNPYVDDIYSFEKQADNLVETINETLEILNPTLE